MPPENPSLDDLEQLPPQTLALRLLQHIPPARTVRRDLLLGELLLAATPTAPGTVTRTATATFAAYPAATRGLVEAWQQLALDGLIVNWPPKDPRYTTDGIGEPFMLTRLGKRILNAGDNGPALLAARRRIGLELHPMLAERLRDAVTIGAFEQAALLALRAIETRVRDLVDDPRSSNGNRLTGVPLMKMAFSARDGPLADPDAEPGERIGTMELFAGAFGAVRNNLVHTEVDWPDPVEAAEYVLLADLLMRLIDRAEHRRLSSISNETASP